MLLRAGLENSSLINPEVHTSTAPSDSLWFLDNLNFIEFNIKVMCAVKDCAI